MSKYKYTFKHSDGHETTVDANDETEARHLAMTKRHGPIKTEGKDRYDGYGIDLIRKELN